MIAASARTSGTTLPASSSLNRGSMASRSAAACTAAFVRATRVRAGMTVFAFTGAFAAAGFAAVVVEVAVLWTTRRFVGVVVLAVVDVEVPTPAHAWPGRMTAETVTQKQISRNAAKNRDRITGKPL